MSQQNQVTLPEQIYRRIQKVAHDSQRSVEAIAIESLGLLFGESESAPEPSHFDAYTDQQLWAVVNQRLMPDRHDRLHLLLEKNQQGRLLDPESSELQELVDEVDRQMLARSEALLLLKQRGYDIRNYLNSHPA
jgi:hypothetical protein